MYMCTNYCVSDVSIFSINKLLILCLLDGDLYYITLYNYISKSNAFITAVINALVLGIKLYVIPSKRRSITIMKILMHH